MYTYVHIYVCVWGGEDSTMKPTKMFEKGRGVGSIIGRTCSKCIVPIYGTITMKPLIQ
jgi:hypothetical protein